MNQWGQQVEGLVQAITHLFAYDEFLTLLEGHIEKDRLSELIPARTHTYTYIVFEVIKYAEKNEFVEALVNLVKSKQPDFELSSPKDRLIEEPNYIFYPPNERLARSQYTELSDALLDAFSNFSSFEFMLLTKCGKRIDELTPLMISANEEMIVKTVLDQASREGWLNELALEAPKFFPKYESYEYSSTPVPLYEFLIVNSTTPNDLAMLLKLHLDKNLDAILGLYQIIFDVIDDAEKHQWLSELVFGACIDNPGNPVLRAYVNKYHPGHNLCKILTDGFDLRRLAIMLRSKMGLLLEEICGDVSQLDDAVDCVVRKATNEKWIDELAISALEFYPGYMVLHEFVSSRSSTSEKLADLTLSGQDAKKFGDALLESFTKSEFEAMLRFSLGKSLEHISLGNSFTSIVWDVLSTSEKEGWITELLYSAYAWVPDNLALRKFVDNLPDELSNSITKSVEHETSVIDI